MPGKFRSNRIRMYYILTALLLLFSVAPALADDTPWYQVEVVIFAHTDATDMELWPDDPGEPNTAKAIQLSPASSTPGLVQRLEGLQNGAGGDGQDRTLAGFLSDQGDAAAAALPVAFRLLPPDADQLQNVISRLGGNADYRVLYHAAWRQPAYGPDKAAPALIHVDPFGTQTAMLTSLQQQSAGASGSSDQTDAGADNPPAPPRSEWLLNGMIGLVQSRYLHLDVDLVYQARTPGAGESQPNGDTEVTRTYRMQQSRRILNDNLYYFDHPRFGVLAKVTPFKLPEPPPPSDDRGQTTDDR